MTFFSSSYSFEISEQASQSFTTLPNSAGPIDDAQMENMTDEQLFGLILDEVSVDSSYK